MHYHVSTSFSKSKRPKIAIIDTGFDRDTVKGLLKKRLRVVSETDLWNWKDYWHDKTVPEDENGHGTAMLSLVHRVAPFADVCVARIAGGDNDLKEAPEATSNNLAKVSLQKNKPKSAMLPCY